mmetsp:Transcript_43610/g.110394  ORF Transcript_43610/g.110394 Transcript_43610/m.110394 type:complete len:272 (-) Transcript_43610:422-1237(-)
MGTPRGKRLRCASGRRLVQLWRVQVGRGLQRLARRAARRRLRPPLQPAVLGLEAFQQLRVAHVLALLARAAQFDNVHVVQRVVVHHHARVAGVAHFGRLKQLRGSVVLLERVVRQRLAEQRVRVVRLQPEHLREASEGLCAPTLGLQRLGVLVRVGGVPRAVLHSLLECAAGLLVAVLAGQADAEVVPQLRSDVGRATVAGDKALPVPQPVRNHQRIPFHASRGAQEVLRRKLVLFHGQIGLPAEEQQRGVVPTVAVQRAREIAHGVLLST